MSSIAERVFTLSDQISFANLSGDFNPMHMDDVAARRTQAGTCAVHGMHSAMWILNHAALADKAFDNVCKIKVQFTKFIALNQNVQLFCTSSNDASSKFEARVNDNCVTSVTLTYGEKRQGTSAVDIPHVLIDVKNDPIEPLFEDLSEISGWLTSPVGAISTASDLFPDLCQLTDTSFVSTLALMSTLVGMISPGLHSIFSGFTIDLGASHTEGLKLGFKPKRIDNRVRLVNLAIIGAGFSGELIAFMRFPPVKAPGISEISTKIEPSRFKGRHALVIGGSRGMGAVITKLIAAGGGMVTSTYASGLEDSENIQAEINAHYNQTRCEIAKFDALDAWDLKNLGDLSRFTHVYYCATKKIGSDNFSVYNEKRFFDYLSVYVTAFHTLMQALIEAANPVLNLSVLYPSTVYVAARPRQLTEYAMAKAAGEVLCVDLGKAHKGLRISTPRLPRMLTDQTATVPPVLENADTLSVVLPLLLSEAD